MFSVIDVGLSRPPAPEIDEAAVMQLAEMGFPLEACRKAVYYTGNMGPEMAFNWIIAHMEEPGKGIHWIQMKHRSTDTNIYTFYCRDHRKKEKSAHIFHIFK